jgi:ligand-binding sensor domain-containing protein
MLILIHSLCLDKVFCQTGQTDIKFTNISIKQGLSQSSPNCIFQDSRGFIWIGTEDGLNKYDGYEFTIYRPVPDNVFSLSHPRILSIAEDLSGSLWIGTNGGGLNKYDRNTNKFSRHEARANDSLSLAGNVVHCILSAPEDELWIGTENGLSVYDLKTNRFKNLKTSYPVVVALSGMVINSLVHEDNIIWIGTTEGLFRYNREAKSLDQYRNSPLDKFSLPGNTISSLLADKYGRLFIGTEAGLAIMDRNTGLFEQPAFPGSPVNMDGLKNIKAMLQDDEGNIWVATFGYGLYIWPVRTESLINFSYDHNNPYSIKNNEVLSLYRDFSGIIWIGTNGIDIYNPKKEKFALYDYVPYSREKLVFRNIHPIYQDAYGVLWIGSKTDGLHILDRKSKNYTRWAHNPASNNGLSSSRIRAIKEYPEGELWIGTEDQGINRVYLDENRRAFRFKQYRHQSGNPNSLTSNKIYAFLADNAGKLWIGTDNGLTVMDIETETFKQYLPDTTHPSNLNNATVYAIYQDRSGNIWLATDMGINRYDATTDGFIHYIHKDVDDNSVIHNEILCFYEDAQGKIWIGTYGKGLDKFDPVSGKFTHYSDVKQLSTAVIYGILSDDDRNLWMSTNNGIIEFNPETGDIKQFSIEDGLQSNEFNGTSYFKSSEGEMFFGGQYGFNSFFPKDIVIDSISPKIVLSDLQVHNISVISGEDAPIITHINEAKEIVLSHKQNNFTLYFSALHFANPALNKYKYKLEGFDDEWIDAGNKRFVSYTNLPYKTYTFRVVAANSDGIWNEQGLSVKIRVRPPYWSTIWFRILMGILLIGGLVFLVKKRITDAQHQKQLFEAKFENSTKELEEARNQMDNQHAEIVIQKRELVQREKDQENLIWFNQGIGIFSDLIGKNRENLPRLCKVVIEKLVEYVDAQQGGVFLLNTEDIGNQQLELAASYGFSDEKRNMKFIAGEGYVGACFADKEFIEVDNLTDNYAVFSSGLGRISLKHLILAPLKVNEQCIGVLELGSFKKIKGFRVTFIEKLMETFASTLSTEQANLRLQQLIERSKEQAKELSENDEKLRMNLEEIMTSQEESSRREDELIKLAEESASHEEMLSQEIEALKNRIEQLTGQPYENQPNSF